MTSNALRTPVDDDTVVSIDLERAEGAAHECVAVTLISENVFAQADEVLRRWALTAPDPENGYHKCDVRLTYSDGATGYLRYDLTRGETVNLAAEVEAEAKFQAEFGPIQ